MFRVKDSSGNVFAVYAVSGTRFLIFRKDIGWYWAPMENYVPVDQLDDLEQWED